VKDFDEKEALERTADDIHLLGEVLRFTLEDLPVILDDIDIALEDGNWPEAARLSHKAKGSAGVCGALRMSLAAMELELSAREGSEKCLKFRDSLDAAFEAFRTHPRVIELSSLDAEGDASIG